MSLEQLRKEGLRRGLSPRTIKTYAYCTNQFLRTVHHKELKDITTLNIKEYLDRFLACGNTYNVHLNALKFLFGEVLHRKLILKVRFHKQAKKLPEFLEKEEAMRLFATINNQKHRLMMELMYGAGLRVSELVHLKVKDLMLEKKYGWVRQGKGNKDRPFIIPSCLMEKISSLIQENGLVAEHWLFCSNRHQNYSTSSIREIIKQARNRCKSHKNIHPHTLRHSFATHVIQNGYNALELQPLLGHSQVQTTLQYVHLAAPNMLHVESPLDGLIQERKQ